MSKLRSTLVLAVSVCLLSACADDPLGVNSGDPLTPEEMQAVFSAISETFSTLSFAPAAAGGPARAVISVNESFSATAPCDIGGSFAAAGSANGTVDDETFLLDLSFQLRLTPNGCIVATETNTVTLNGAPYVQLSMDFELNETQIVAVGTQTGGIAFTSSDGRSGSCAFEVSFSVTADLEGQSGSSSVSGTVCGVSATGLQVFDVGSPVT
ncbi:MAG: hypothetical protein OEO79_10550 [Gemmatimonadota bacterium]|nr:hypothetical protein [Gemmatimonadota bacterium]MDH3422627.1 hypothetical protein [Gemmatimonadota bacterium]